MTALLRVKRKISNEPSEALVVASKKARNDTEVETVFKFLATLKRKEEHTDEHIDSLIKRRRSERVQWGKSPKIRNTDFKSANKNYKEKRLKLLNIHRNLPCDVEVDKEDLSSSSLATDEAPCDEVKNVFKLYDVHDEETDDSKAHTVNKNAEDIITCNGIPLLSQAIDFKSEEGGYVYDLYYAGDDSFNPTAENVLSIKECTLENQLVYPDFEGDSDCFDDDDDSNDEDNWRNDYPEEEIEFEKSLDYYDDFDYTDEDDLLARIHDCDIDCSEDDDDQSRDRQRQLLANGDGDENEDAD